MAQYLQINDTLISYSLGDNLTSPSKVLFLVSDTQFSESESWFTIEYAYNYDQPIGDTQQIQLPFVAEIENKFYYSLPWRTIQFIDSTTPGEGAKTPTPSPSPSATITPTFFEEEPIDEYIYDSMEAVSIKGGAGESSSVVGYNNRKLDTIHGVNGVTGLTLETDIVTLTKPGRYYIKARSGSYVSEWTSTTIYFISGDYETQRFESQRRWCHAGTNSSDVVVTESSVVVDITQDTTFKIQTYISKAKSGNGLSYGGGASVFVQKLANADGGSSSGGSSSSGISASCDPFELARTTLHMQSDTTDGDSNVFDLYGFETISNNGVVHTTENARSNFGATNFKFDNTYLYVPNQGKLDFVNNDFTIDFWYYKQTHKTSSDLDTIFAIEKSTTHHDGNSCIEFSTNPDGTFSVQLDYTDGTYPAMTIPSGKITNQTWNYITITRNNDDAYLYVNDEEVDTLDMAGKQIAFDVNMYLVIGGRNGTNLSSMYLQDFRIRKGVSGVNPVVPTELVSVSCDGSGSSSSGGIGSNQLVANKSNFYTSLPDVLLITYSNGSLGSFFLNWIEDKYVYYQLGLIESASPIPAVIKFDNNNQGNFALMYNATTSDFPNAGHSISEHLAAGRGIYYGGASSSGGSSSSGGISTWGVFDGTEGTGNDITLTLQAGENIDSIKRTALGIYEVTMTTPMSSEYYSVSVDCNPLGTAGSYGGVQDLYSSDTDAVPTASKFRIDIRDHDNLNKNPNRITFHVVGGASGTSAFEVSTDTTDSTPIEIEAPSTTSDAENFMDNLTFKNPPNNITINDVVFHFISHSSEYIKYQGLSKYNDTYTIFFNDDTNGTLKMTSDDDTSIFVGVLSLISYKYE